MSDYINPVKLTGDERQLLNCLYRPLHELECFDLLRPTGSKRNLVSVETATEIRNSMKAFLGTRPDILVKDALDSGTNHSLRGLYGTFPGHARTSNSSSFNLDEEWRRFTRPAFVNWLESVGLKVDLEWYVDLPKSIHIYEVMERDGRKSLSELGFRDTLPLALLESVLLEHDVKTLHDLAMLPVPVLYKMIVQSEYSDDDKTYEAVRYFLETYYLEPGMFGS